MSVYQLMYYSKAKEDVDQPEVDSILEKAIDANAEKDITGILMFHSGVFLQFIEGEKPVVQELFEKIKKDQRHQDVVVVAELDSQERIFPDCSMGYCTACDFEPNMAKHIEEWRSHISQKKAIDTIDALKIVNKFKAALQRRSA